jgi:hypothetical protein
VDLICKPKNMELLRQLSPVKEDKVRIVFNDEGAKIEVWVADGETYELKKWYRRMPRKRFIELASKARAQGMKLSWRDGLQTRDGKTIINPAEIEKMLEA